MKNQFGKILGLLFAIAIICIGFSVGGFYAFGANEALALDGGAIYLKTGAKYTMGGGSITNKSATNGGAVYVSDGATFTMNGGKIYGNSATYGSGVYVASGGTYNMNGGTMEDEVYLSGTMVYAGGTVSGNITLNGAERLTINAKPSSVLNITALSTAVGTKLAKVNASDFSISDINVSGLPTGRRAVLSGEYLVVDYVYYTVTIGVNTSGYGTVSKTSVSVPYGTSVSVSGSTLTIGSNTITATATTATVQYTYAFSSWTNASGTVTSARTITANFTRTTNQYTVTLGTGYGSWDTSTAITVDYGTAISVSSNKLTVGSTTRTFTASADTAQYDYTFSSLSGVPSGGKVVGNVTITPNVTRTTKTYTVTIAVNDSGYGTVSKSSITVDYGTSISASGATLTVGSNTITATPTTKTAEYTYAFSSWTGASGTVTSAKTITANFTRTANSYAVTVANGTGISAVSGGGTYTYGSSVTISATVATGYTWKNWTGYSTTTTRSYTFTMPAENVSYTANATINSYTATFDPNGGYRVSDTNYNAVSYTYDYGETDSISERRRTGYTLIGYTITDTSGGNNIGGATATFNSSTKTGTFKMGTANVIVKMNWQINSYTVTLGTGYGSWDTSTAITATYGTSISVNSNKLTVGSTTRTFTASADTAQYDYTFSSLSGVPGDGKVVGNVTITPNVTRTTKTYTVTIAVNDSGYGSLSSTSVTSVPYGSTIKVGSSSNILSVNGTNITATATSQTAQYSYAFSKWTQSSTSGTQVTTSGFTITGATTVYANFTRTTNTYTVTIAVGQSGYGSLSSTSVANVPYGSTIKVGSSSNILSVNGTSITATASSTTAQYTYAFSKWTLSSTSGTQVTTSGFTITGATTVYANFTRTTNTYTVTIAVGQSGYGSLSSTSVANVPYGSTIKVGSSSNILSVNGTSITATVSSTTAQYTYAFSKWTQSSTSGTQVTTSGFTISGATTIYANFTRTTRTYAITWKNYDGTTLETDSAVAYGTTPTYNGSTPTREADATYAYTFSGWSPAVASVTGAQTYTAQYTTQTVTHIKVYVDGSLSKTLYKPGTSYTIVETEVPLTYENCCGYFYDSMLSKGTGGVVDLSNGTVSIYTKTATVSKFTFTYNSSTKTYDVFPASTSISGDIVFPKEYSNTQTTLLNTTTEADGAFYSHTSITGVTFQDGLTMLGSNAFNGCTGLTGNIIIPDSVTRFGDRVFKGCSNLNGTLYLSKNLTNIGYEGFYNCSKLSGTLTIPDKVTSISTYAFNGCSGFTGDLIIPDSVTSMGSSVFDGCSGFTGNLVIGNSVTSIAYRTFANCTGLKGTLTIGNSVKTTGQAIFQGCSGLTGNIVIPDSVTEIGNSAFRDCSGFNGTLTLSANLVTIIKGAFANCAGLKGNLIIPSKVTTIGDQVFNSCSGFTSVYLPSSVTSIDATSGYNSPFGYWNSSAIIYTGIADASSVPSGFGTCWSCYTGYPSNLSLTVKYGYSLEQYKAAVGISTFAPAEASNHIDSYDVEYMAIENNSVAEAGLDVILNDRKEYVALLKENEKIA